MVYLYKTGFISLIALFFLLSPLFWTNNFTTYQFSKMTLFIVSTLMAGIFYSFHIICSGRSPIKKVSVEEVLMIMFLAVMIIAGTKSVNPYLSGKVISQWGCYSLLFILALRMDYSARTIILLSINVALAITSLRVIGEYFGIFQTSWASGQPSAWMGNPNFLGEYLVAALPMVLALKIQLFSLNKKKDEKPNCKSSHKHKRRLINKRDLKLNTFVINSTPFFLAIVISAIFFSGARASMLGSAAAVLIILAGSRIVMNRKYALTSLLAFSILLSFPAVSNRIALSFSGVDSSGSFRLLTWSGTIDLIVDNPLLGVGPGNYEIAYEPYRSLKESSGITSYDRIVKNPHNSFLRIASETGLAGFLVFSAMIASILMKALVYVKRENVHGVTTSLCWFASIAAGGVNAFFSSGLYKAVPASLFWLSAAWLLTDTTKSASGMNSAEYLRDKNARRNPLQIGLFIMPVLFFGTIGIASQSMLSSGDYWYANYSIVNNALSKLKRTVVEKNRTATDDVDKTFLSLQKKKSAFLSESLKYSPERIEALFELARNHHNNGRLKEAEEIYQNVLRLSPNYRNAWNNIGNVYFDQNDMDKSEAAYDQAIRISPEYPLAHANMGALLTKKAMDSAKDGNSQLAERAEYHLRKCLAVKPEHAEALRAFGVLYYYVFRDMNRAKLWFHRYLNLNSGANDKGQILRLLGES